ncbi:MAG TPA: glycosyltransferase family 4 protein [Candidatus Limnocylindrales bacterium]|nr:glycosyltransferase family 4 protein [Candidatus Limnocylindrales bacterium]
MRVVHVIKVKGIAGAENHLLILLEALRARGIDASFLYLHPPENTVEAFKAAAEARGIPVQRLPIARNTDPLLYRRLRAALSALQPDVVNTHLLHADLYGIPAARTLRVNGRRPRIISGRHNDDAFRLKADQRVINHQLWRMTDAGVAISEAVRRFSIDVEGARPEQVRTIYYGYQPPPFDPALRPAVRAELGLAPEDVVIGVTCRLIEQKGLPYGLQAFAQIAGEFPAAKLVITGEGELRGALEAQAAELGIDGRTRFIGWRPDAARVMAAYDLFLMPSLWEGFGLVLLEAMAQAIPVVGSRVSALPEVVVEGETGLLAAPRDAAMLATHLRTLLADEPLRRHMGLLGQDRLETVFSVARMTDQVLALYEELMQK